MGELKVKTKIPEIQSKKIFVFCVFVPFSTQNLETQTKMK
jgi:hypothetical protein